MEEQVSNELYQSIGARIRIVDKGQLDILVFLGPIFVLKPRPLMILLEGFLVRPIISLTKNPSRRIINSLGLSRKIGPY